MLRKFLYGTIGFALITLLVVGGWIGLTLFEVQHLLSQVKALQEEYQQTNKEFSKKEDPNYLDSLNAKRLNEFLYIRSKVGQSLQAEVIEIHHDLSEKDRELGEAKKTDVFGLLGVLEAMDMMGLLKKQFLRLSGVGNEHVRLLKSKKMSIDEYTQYTMAMLTLYARAMDVDSLSSATLTANIPADPTTNDGDFGDEDNAEDDGSNEDAEEEAEPLSPAEISAFGQYGGEWARYVDVALFFDLMIPDSTENNLSPSITQPIRDIEEVRATLALNDAYTSHCLQMAELLKNNYPAPGPEPVLIEYSPDAVPEMEPLSDASPTELSSLKNNESPGSDDIDALGASGEREVKIDGARLVDLLILQYDPSKLID